MRDIKTKIIAGFELLLLVSRGVKKFKGEKQEALKSFIIPFALFPVSLWFSFVYPPKGMENGYPDSAIFAVVTGKFLIALIFTLVAVSYVSKLLKKADKFWLFVEASNWTSVAMSVVSIPFMVAAIYGFFPREEMDRILALLEVYGYVVTACIAWRAFETFWQIAGAIAILTLFVNQETGHLLYFMMGIPIPW